MKKKICEKLGIPENFEDFFDPAIDYEFQDKHPVKYWIFTALGITVTVLPAIIYYIYIYHINPAKESGLIFFGFAGAMILGIGLFNIVASFMKQYLGHFVTGSCIIIGGLIIILTSKFLYDEKMYVQVNEVSVRNYIFSVIFICLMAVFYWGFWWDMEFWMDLRKVKKREQKMRGLKEFWWFERIHKEYNMGWIYKINKTFSVLFCISTVLAVLLAWNVNQFKFVAILFFVESLLCTILKVYGKVQSNLRQYRKAIIIHKRDEYGISENILEQIFFSTLPLIVGMVLMMIVLDIV